MRSSTLAPHRAAGIAALLLGLWACGPESGGALPTVELPLEQRFAPNEALHNVRDLAVAPTGDVWVVAGMEPFLHRYAPDGTLRGSFGRSGRGPGELLYPQSLTFTAPGSLRIWDQGRRQLVDLTPEGSFTQRSVAVQIGVAPVMADLESLSYARGRLLRPWGDGYLLQEPTGQLSSARGIAETLLLVLDSSGVVVDTLVDFRALAAPAAEPLGSARELVPIPLWTTCPSGGAAVYDPYAGSVAWYAPGAAAPRHRAAITLPSRPVTDADIRRWMSNAIALEARQQGLGPDSAQQAQLIERALRDGRSRFGVTAPPAVTMLCDPHDRLWFQMFDTEDDPRGFGREWLVVREGRPERRVRFPMRFQPLVVAEAQVFGVSRDDLDVEYPAVVPLEAR